MRDRSKWPRGPWDAEPDKLQWRTEAGLPGLIVRGPMGNLCGYVGVVEGHPCFGRDYCRDYERGADGETDYEKPLPNPVIDLQVHGGITYGAACAGHICHVPEPGESDHVWWLGFDAGHSGDFSPGMASLLREAWRPGDGARRDTPESRGETYRDVIYMRGEVEQLAEQLAALAVPA
jgi:hypothetical protein